MTLTWNKIFEVRDADGIRRLDLAVHGAKFSIENLLFDTSAAAAALTFEHMRIAESVVERRYPPFWKMRVPVRLWQLSFEHVEQVSIDDIAEVGWYQIEDISSSPGRLTLEATPPLTITFLGSEPCISVEVSQNILEWKSFNRLAFRPPVMSLEDPLHRRSSD
jgi:hypothetical protein